MSAVSNSVTVATTAAPVITTSPVCVGATSVTGTSEANAAITVYKGGSTSVGTATANGSGNWTATVTALSAGDIITAKATSAGKCESAASSSITVNTTDAPVVSSPICVGATSVSGTSTEADATIVEIFVDGASKGTTTVSGGAWTKSSLTALTAGQAVTAYATHTGECVSAVSNSVTTVNSPSAPTLGAITEPTCSVSTGSAVLSGLPASGTWTINPGGITGTGTSTTITGLTTGTYNYTVTAGLSGCTSLPSANVILNGLGKSWASPHDGYFVWFQDDPADRYGPTTMTWVDGVTASGMSAGSGVTLTIASDGGTVFKSDGVNSNSYASAVTNNDYIKTTITIPAGNSKIRLTGAALRTTSTAYKWSMAVVDLSTSNFTTLFQDIDVPAYSDVISASAITPYEMLPGKSYEVRWYMNTGSVTSTNVNIDNCDLQFEPLLSAPVVGTITELTPCTTATGSVVLSGLSSTNPWTIKKTPGGQIYTGSGSSTTIIGLSAGTYTFSVMYFHDWYSSESCSVVINSTAICNVPPVITSNGGGSTASINIAENTTAITTVTATDSDDPAQTLTYSITGGADQALFSINSSSGTLTFISAPDYESPTDAGANNVYDVQITVTDNGTGNLSDVQDIAVTVTNVNEPPVLASIEGSALAYTENDASSVVTSSITLNDVDDVNMESATVAITGNFAPGEDVLSFTNQNGISGSYNAGTGVLILTGSSSKANYEAALRSVAYTNSSEDPSTATRTVSYKVYDGDLNSNTAVRTITVSKVNDAPVLASIEGSSLSYTENEGAVAITSSITVSDVDDTNMEGATVAFSTFYVPGEDLLGFTNQNGITGVFNAGTGVLTLTGPATKANYQAALRSITYNNSSENPYTNEREISYTVYDGELNSNTQTRTIIVSRVNDAPVLASIEGAALSYTENAGPVAVTSTITVSDVDDTNIESAIVAITGNYYSTEDKLFFTDTNNITGNWNATTGTLTLTGSDLKANYQTALRSITYSNSSESPSTSTRTVSFTVYDGDLNSNIATRDITVSRINDTPVAVADHYSVNEGATLTVNGMLGVLSNDTDADANTLSAIKLANPSHGTVTLNSDGSFTYTHDGSETTSDSFTYKVNDGTVDGNTVTVSITINPVNDPPVSRTESYGFFEGVTSNTPVSTGVLVNDTDAEGDHLTAIKVTDPVHGTLVLNPDGSSTYTHDGSETTSDSFSYKANDGTSDGNIVTVNIIILPVNDWPVAVPDAYTIDEGGTLTIAAPGILANDTDGEGDNLTAVKAEDPAHGVLTLNADGSFTYMHDGSETTSDIFKYWAHDGQTLGNMAEVRITVNPVNDPPVAVNDVAAVNEDTSLNGASLLANDSDPEGNTLSIDTTPVSGPSHGTLIINTDGTYRYIPSPNYNGTDSFIYKVCDNGTPSMCSTASVFITVNSVNDPPVAVADTYLVSEGGTLNVGAASGVLSNDSDVEGNNLTAVKVSDPSHGTLTLGSDGSFTYIHDGSETTSDSFKYKINDGIIDGNTVTVTITVTPVNDSPLANNDNYTLNEDGTLNGSSLLDNDNDPEGNRLTIDTAPVSGPSHGILTINQDGTFTYRPFANYNGNDSFTYKVCDDGIPSKCSTAAVNITVNAVNDAPVAVNDAVSVNEDGVLIGSSLLSNDSDPEGNSLTIDTTPVSGPSHGSLAINTNGTYTYTPASNYNGSDSFTYRVCDNGSPSLCSTAVVSITVNAVNDAPVAVGDIAVIDEDGILNGTSLLANDSDPEGNTLTISTTPVNGPSHGILTINANGTYSYRPNANYNGSDSFTYRVCDNGSPSQCSTATVTITVNAVNDAPLAVADHFEAKENRELTGNIVGNDSDIEGNSLLVSLNPVKSPLHGTLTLSANGDFVYKPKIDFLGMDSFTYEICDNGSPSRCSTAIVTVNVIKDENCEVFVPNAFSPNADGIHDYYKIRCLYNYANPVIEIYNRWGNLVYKKEHYGDTDYWGSEAEAWWNGYSDNKLNIGKGELPVGTYYYILRLNSNKVLTGFLFLNR